MATSIKYFSAEVAEPNSRMPNKRIRIRNRNHPSTFTDYLWKNAREVDQTLNGQLKALFHSPSLKVELLWHDPMLGLFFYRTIEEL